MHERTGMHEPASMLAAATGCWLQLAAAAAAHPATAAISMVAAASSSTSSYSSISDERCYDLDLQLY
jgi:hypothetical protein